MIYRKTFAKRYGSTKYNCTNMNNGTIFKLIRFSDGELKVMTPSYYVRMYSCRWQ